MRKTIKKNIINIYIVDDNELDAGVLAQDFELNTTFDIQQFNSGERFLKDLISNPPPKKNIVIIIIDYQLNTTNLDAKNGIDILKTVKSINHDYEVIMISAHPDVDIVTSALHYEAVTFVKKNENSFMRIQNNINWIISKKNLKRKKMDSLKTIMIFSAVLVLFIILVLIVSSYFPELISN